MVTPVFTFAGVPLTAQHLDWRTTPGFTPDTLQIAFPRPHGEAIKAAVPDTGYVDLAIGTSMSGFAADVAITRTVKHLLLLEPDTTGSPYEMNWTLADSRWWLQSLRFIDTSNLRRRANDLGVLLPEQAGAPLDVGRLSGLVDGSTTTLTGAAHTAKPTGQKPFLTFGKLHYLEWTLDGGKVRTALAIVRRILGYLKDTAPTPAAAVAAAMLDGLKAAGISDNGYFEADVTPNFESVAALLAYWSERAEISCAPEDDGTFRFWTLTDDRALVDVIKPLYPTMPGGGHLSTTDRSRRRAGVVVCAFPQWREERFTAHAPWVEAAGTGAFTTKPVRAVQNVVQLVRDIAWKGKTYRKGTWMLMDDYLAALQLQWAAEADGSTKFPFFGKFTIGDTWVRENWLPQGILQRWFCELYGGAIRINPVYAEHCAAIRMHYRQTWRISPLVMPYILQWEPRRAGIVDVVSGTPAPAYVSVDHCTIPDISLIANVRKPGAAGTNVEAVDSASTAAGSHGAPAHMFIVDHDEGVFRVQHDLFSGGEILSDAIPSKVDDIPMARIGGALNTLWDRAKLTALYKGFFIFLVRWGSDPWATGKESNPRVLRQAQLYDLAVTPAMAGNKMANNTSLRHEIPCSEDTARWPVQTATMKPAKPLNYEQLSALAKSKARAYWFSMRDRLVGRWTFPGWSAAYKPYGSVRSIIMSINENGRITTTFDCTDEPKPRALFHQLPREVRRVVFRELPEPRK